MRKGLMTSFKIMHSEKINLLFVDYSARQAHSGDLVKFVFE